MVTAEGFLNVRALLSSKMCSSESEVLNLHFRQVLTARIEARRVVVLMETAENLGHM